MTAPDKPNAYITLLYDDGYLPGVVALHCSLQRVHACVPLLVLVVEGSVAPRTLQALHERQIDWQYVAPIRSPYPDTPKVFEGIFTKLRILEMAGYRKIVYIDADMLVCHNVDELFDKPSWSAVNAGGMLPECSDWVDMNAGFLVIEPNPQQLQDILQMLPLLPSKDRGDQGFLHHYFPDWPSRSDLHLDHRYNLYAGHLDRYHELFGYDLTDEKTDRSVCLVHYWGPRKPWYAKVPAASKGPLHEKSFRLWGQVLEEAEPAGSDYGAGSTH